MWVLWKSRGLKFGEDSRFLHRGAWAMWAGTMMSFKGGGGKVMDDPCILWLDIWNFFAMDLIIFLEAHRVGCEYVNGHFHSLVGVEVDCGDHGSNFFIKFVFPIFVVQLKCIDVIAGYAATI